MHLFDTVLITASSERQAEAFRALVARRREHGLYPRELAFEVVADPPGGRVGTGGSTLWALDRLVRERADGDPEGFLARQRILLIHAGGESRRLPCYAPEGKLFAPLPLPSSALLPPVVLDAQLGPLLRVPVAARRGGRLLGRRRDRLRHHGGARGARARLRVLEGGPGRAGIAPRRLPLRRAARAGGRLPAEGAPPTSSRDRPSSRARATARSTSVSSRSPPEAAAAFLDLGRTPLEAGTLLDGLADGRVRFDLYLEVLTACLPGLSFEAVPGEGGRGERPPLRARAPRLRRLPPVRPRGHGDPLHDVRARGERRPSCRRPPAACSPAGSPPSTSPRAARSARSRPRTGSSTAASASSSTVAGTAPVLVEGCASSSLRLAGDNLVVGLEGRALPFELPRGFVLDERAAARGPGGGRPVRRGTASRPRAIPSRLVFCGQPLDAWLAERGLAPRRRLRRRRRRRPLRGPALRPRPVARRPARLRRARRERSGRGASARRAASPWARSRSGTTPCGARTAGSPSGASCCAGLFRRGQGWRDVSVPDFVSAFSGPEWPPALEPLARPHRRRPAARRTASDRGARWRRRPRPPPLRRDRLRGAGRPAAAAPPRPQGGPDRVGAGPGAARPRRGLDRHAALHPAERRPGGEPRRGPERPAPDPGLLPAHRGAARPRALDRPRPHRDLHELPASSSTTATPSRPSPSRRPPSPSSAWTARGPGEPTLADVARRARGRPRDHAALRRAQGLRPRHLVGPGRGHPGRALALLRPARRPGRARPAGPAGRADAHHRRRLAGPGRGPPLRRQVRREPARGCGRTPSSTSSTRSSSRTGTASAASPSSTRASRGSRRTSSPTWSTG